jgi:hypothetical protein
MKKLLFIVFIFSVLGSTAQVEYMSPKPGSKFNNPETNIIIRFTQSIDIKSLSDESFHISGSISGNHIFSFKLAENNKVIIIKTNRNFAFGETITFNSKNNIRNIDGDYYSMVSFTFAISEKTLIKETDREYPISLQNISTTDIYPNFPSLTINTNNNPAEGKIFFHNISALESAKDRYIAIIENDGTPVFAKQDNKKGLGFTLQKNGYLTYWNNKSFYMLDSSYSVIDSFACKNGYDADWHEFQMTKNGHAFLISWDLQIVDMSKIVAGGQEYATVEGLIIQELDENKDLIFQWRSWDHFNITDAVDVDFTTSYVSYNHGNAIEIDSDTTLLLSSRLMNEITRINRKTGEIIWRLGGKNNQFTFINDDGFCRQHDIRKLENGNITLFDNGSCHDPKISSAKEYELDEINKTAKLVWKYEHPTKMYCETMGNVQRLSNGNTFINWGRLPDSGMLSENHLPSITEVRPDKSIAYELTFNTFFHMAYRSYRFKWDVTNPVRTEDDIQNSLTDISIFPNPADEFLNLDISLKKPEIIDITVINSSGNVVKNIAGFKAQEGVNRLKINSDNFQNGMYLCRVKSNTFELSKKVFIVR